LAVYFCEKEDEFNTDQCPDCHAGKRSGISSRWKTIEKAVFAGCAMHAGSTPRTVGVVFRGALTW
jgi:hypothetical protein